MDLGLKGKIAMVAAGTRGIGLAAAKSLAAEGATVSVCGLDPDRIKEAASALGAPHMAVRCDVASKAAIESWFAATRKALGDPHILVTNTGGPPAGPLSELSEEQWAKGFENTVMNVVRMVALASPAMKAARWGRIVHITSLVAKDPDPLLPVSSTLRAGLSAMCRLSARELGPHGVTVNCVLPGSTETDRQTHLLEVRAQKSGRSVAEERRLAESAVPVGRLAKPAEIGDVVSFLCSERAGFINGALVVVDGGMSRGPG